MFEELFQEEKNMLKSLKQHTYKNRSMFSSIKKDSSFLKNDWFNIGKDFYTIISKKI